MPGVGCFVCGRGSVNMLLPDWAVLDAMLARDPEGTRRAMQAHFAQGLQAAT